MDKDEDGTLLFTADEARRLVEEMNLGTPEAKAIGELLTDALEESDPLERVIFIRIMP